MLYPLSYEGLRATSYLPGQTQKCPGVPGAAIRGLTPPWERFRRWSEQVPSTFGATEARMVVSIGQAPRLTSGAIGSPSNRRVHEST
jgi:hypothetical protein